MKVVVRSHLTWRQDLSGELHLASGVTVGQLVQSFNLLWGEDAMVVVNNQMVDESYELQEGDQVELLVPLVGG